jgi:hypothetical protein
MAICCLLWCASSGYGAVAVESFSEPHYWHNKFVIFGKVKSVEVSKEDFTHAVTVVPLATIAGNYDSSLQNTLEFGIVLHPQTSSVQSLPEVDKTYILILQTNGVRYSATSAFIKDLYIAGLKGQPIIQAESLSEKKSLEIIEAIKASRVIKKK